MRTLGDALKDAYVNYIAPSKEKETMGKKEKTLVRPGEWATENVRHGYEKLSPSRRRDIANESPLLMKGIRKKSLDSFRAWFSIKTPDGHGAPAKADIEAFQKFEERTNAISKFYEARVASHIYGDGFILISFTGDDDVPLNVPPRDNAEPIQLYVLNSEYINDVTPDGDYVYRKDAEEKIIHKDRIIHIAANKIPGFKLGVSTIDLLRWTMYSKKNVDIAAGHILSWFAHGIVDLTWENMGEEEAKIAKKMLESHGGSYFHDQDVKIDVKNPTAIDPEPFYNYIVLNIAGALNMPTHVLTGIQTGRVTGSEIGFADYYRDVRDEQDILMTPLIVSLYERILKARGKSWKYRILWNPIYIDEMAEATLLEKRVNAAKEALASGIIDLEESRMIINDGQIVIDTNKKITPPMPKPDRKNPDDGPQPPARQKKTPNENQAMIERWKAYRQKQLDAFEELVNDNTSSDRNEGNAEGHREDAE